MTTPDPTMTALLGVHRAELDAREEQIDDLESQLTSLRRLYEQEMQTSLAARDTAKKRQTIIDEQRDRLTKLEGVIESLKIELADTREAATAARQERK